MKAVIIHPETPDMERQLEALARHIEHLLINEGYEADEFSVTVKDLPN